MTIAINKYFKIKHGIQFEDGTTATSLSNLVGAKGDTGTAATIVLGTVSTGTTAEVTNTGTSENVYLNFVIPYVPGPKGDPGNNGSNGNTGTQGIQGPIGNTGTAATITIGSVTTGSAAVTNTGTIYNAYLNFTIPQGPTGPAGPTGATGSTGTTGAAGAAGATNIMVFGSAALNMTATANAVNTNLWTIFVDGGVSGVSVSGANGTITLPAGTYLLEVPTMTGSNNTVTGIRWRNFSDSENIATWSTQNTTINGATRALLYGGLVKFVLAATKNVGFASDGTSANFTLVHPGQITAVGSNVTRDAFIKIYKTA